MIYRIIRLMAFVLCKIIFRLKVYGKKNLPPKGGFILASNHVSLLDPIILGAVSFRKLNFLAKKELFRNKIFAWYLYRLQTFPIERGTRDISAIREAIKRLKQGKVLLLFPEGTRSKDGSIQDFQPGIKFFADKTKVPIIPVFIKGTERALPKHAKFIHPSNISVAFGSPFYINDKSSHSEIAKQLHQRITGLAKQQ